jgi:hypothetical protein
MPLRHERHTLLNVKVISDILCRVAVDCVAVVRQMLR